MKNKILALFLAVLMMFSLFAAPAVYATEEETTQSVSSSSTNGDISDMVGDMFGEDLQGKQDEANAVIENGYNFANSLLSFIENIRNLIIKFLDIFMVFVD